MRVQLMRQIEKKKAELQSIETERVRVSSYLQALEDMLRSLPKEREAEENDSPQPSKGLRQGSELAKARNALLAAGRPMHIAELVEAIGKPVDARNKVSLAGSIGALVREKRYFTRPGPNIFGLVEFSDAASEAEITSGGAEVVM